MGWLSTGIGVLGSLFGGKSSEKAAMRAAITQRRWALEDQREQFVRLRAAAEKGGFNPLAALQANPGGGMVNPTPVSSNNYMGTAIAESAVLIADQLAQSKAASMGRTVEDLNRQKDILTRKLTENTLRPKVAGIYGIGGANAAPTRPAVGSGPYSGPFHSSRIDAVEPRVSASTETYTSHGSATSVYRGPDFDEIAMGWFIDQLNKGKARRRFENTDEARAGGAQRFRPAPPAPPPKIRMRDVLRGTLPPVFWGVGS